MTPALDTTPAPAARPRRRWPLMFLFFLGISVTSFGFWGLRDASLLNFPELEFPKIEAQDNALPLLLEAKEAIKAKGIDKQTTMDGLIKTHAKALALIDRALARPFVDPVEVRDQLQVDKSFSHLVTILEATAANTASSEENWQHQMRALRLGLAFEFDFGLSPSVIDPELRWSVLWSLRDSQKHWPKDPKFLRTRARELRALRLSPSQLQLRFSRFFEVFRVALNRVARKAAKRGLAPGDFMPKNLPPVAYLKPYHFQLRRCFNQVAAYFVAALRQSQDPSAPLRLRHLAAVDFSQRVDFFEGVTLVCERNFVGRRMSQFVAKYIDQARLQWGLRELLHEVVVTELALRAYQIEKSAMPKKLSELVPDYLESLPRDVFSRGALQYDPDRRILYSLGLDDKDSGGLKERFKLSSAPPEDPAWLKEPTFWLDEK